MCHDFDCCFILEHEILIILPRTFFASLIFIVIGEKRINGTLFSILLKKLYIFHLTLDNDVMWRRY